MPVIDSKLCISCGSCARVCPAAVITMEDGAPAVHPERRCMECWHCAAACPQKAVRQAGLELYPPVPEDELERLVGMRRSVRHFKRTPPDRQVIARALEQAAWAPTAKNRRTYGWTVLYGRERVEELLALVLDWAAGVPKFQMLAELVKGHRDPVTCESSCVLFGHNIRSAGAETDTVIAAATAELLLVRQGVGTCWGGYLRRAVDESPVAREFLGIPEERGVYAVLLSGIPDGEPYCGVPYRPRPEIQWR